MRGELSPVRAASSGADYRCATRLPPHPRKLPLTLRGGVVTRPAQTVTASLRAVAHKRRRKYVLLTALVQLLPGPAGGHHRRQSDGLAGPDDPGLRLCGRAQRQHAVCGGLLRFSAEPIILPIRVGRFSYGIDQTAAAEHAWQYRTRP